MSLVRRLAPSLPAVLAFVAYTGGAAALGETFPFSRLPMYATSPTRTEGAVLEVRVAGEVTTLAALQAVEGVDPGALSRPGVPSSMGYAIREAQRWLLAHPADGRDPAEALPVEIGFRLVGHGAGPAPEWVAGLTPGESKPPVVGEPPVGPLSPADAPTEDGKPPEGPPRNPGDLVTSASGWVVVATGKAWR